MLIGKNDFAYAAAFGQWMADKGFTAHERMELLAAAAAEDGKSGDGPRQVFLADPRLLGTEHNGPPGALIVDAFEAGINVWMLDSPALVGDAAAYADAPGIGFRFRGGIWSAAVFPKSDGDSDTVCDIAFREKEKVVIIDTYGKETEVENRHLP